MLPAGRLRGHSVFPAMAPPMRDIDHDVMPHFLVEIHMSDAGEPELERAVRMLEAAQGRLRGGVVGRAVIAGISREDGRLICLIESTTLTAARRTLEVALLPPGRVREISRIADTGVRRTRDPRGDADP